MQQIKFAFRRHTAQAAIAASAAALLLGCSSDHFLGDMSDTDIVDDEDDSAAGGGQDFLVSPALAAPDLTMADPVDLGSLSAAIGDFDGDGFDDFASRNYESNINLGEYVLIRYGGERPADDLEAWDWSLRGVRLVSDLGVDSIHGIQDLIRSISPVGDVDADGYADIIVGLAHCGNSTQNGVHLVYGGPERPEGVRRLSERGVFLRDPNSSGSQGGCALGAESLYPLGDFDGDGFDDFMLGGYLFYGSAERLETGTTWSDADVRIVASHPVGSMPIGDVNGDGLGDLIIGGSPPIFNPTELDGYYWLPGQSERLSRDIDLSNVELQPRHGIAFVRGVGDLDGDGLDDVLIHDDLNASHLVYGAPGLFDDGIDLSLAAATFPGGVELTRAGDLDGDGDDELVAAQSDEGGNVVALLSGSSTRLNGAVQLPTPSSPYDWPDLRVARVFPIGDLDGDGSGELSTRSIIQTGDAYDYGAYDDGALHIHYGIPGGAGSVISATPR